MINDTLIIFIVISLFVIFGGIIGIISHFISKYMVHKLKDYTC
jgi:uncharacterized protein YneF (UPF0154 family)